MTEKPATGDDSKTRQELLEEVLGLRARLAESEADLQATNERHQTLSRAINIGYWEWDETVKRAAHFSREMADILGMSLEALYEIYQCEEDFFKYVHPDDLPHYIANLSGVLDPDHPRGQAYIFEYRIVRPNGELRYVRELEYGTREVDGETVHSYGAIQDVTDLHESTRARVESEQRYSSLFSKLPLGAQEQDWSAIKQAVDKLQSEGVGDLKLPC
jgi:PAS domain-containing protein